MAALVVVVVVWLIVNGRRPAPRLLFQSEYAAAWQMADGTIHLRRLNDGKTRVYLPSDQMYSKLLTGGKQ